MYALSFIYRNLDRFRARFFGVLVAGFADGLASFFIPVLLAEFTKSDFTLARFQTLLVFIVLCYLASVVLQWVIRRYGEGLGAQLANHIRLKYFAAFERLSAQELAARHSGYLLSLANKIADGIAPTLFDIFWTFAKGSATMALFFYFTARESVSIAMVNLVILVIFITVSTFLSRKMVPLAGDLNTQRASLLESYADFMANILTVKRLGVYSFAEKRLLEKTETNYAHIQRLQNFHANRWFFLHTLFGIAFLSTLGFLLYQVSLGAISASILILFIAAYATIRGNVERVAESFKYLMEMKAYMTSLDDIIAKGAHAGGRHEIQSWREVSFRDVSFHYPESAKKITVPKFRIARGEIVRVIGKSGEGKTTFLNLFANFLTSGQGERLVDGQAYESVSDSFFHKNITVISQDIELFNMSLRDNIALGGAIGEKEIIEALEELDLGAWSRNLEKGLDTIVGEKGIKLSAGQKQRINILRGVLLGRDILLLDEPTAHLDAATEEKVIAFLQKHLSGKTAIIVSHHEAVKKLCGRSYEVKNHALLET